MFFHFHEFLRNQINQNIHYSLFDSIVSITLKEYPKKIKKIADCGAGIGCTAKRMHDIIKEYEDDFEIHCYEPFVPNFNILRNHLKSNKFILHQLAVSDQNQICKFKVPNFVEKSFGLWSAGSSYSGSLVVDLENDNPNSIEVSTIRLDSSGINLDLIKLDLQGGEYNALIGLGENLDNVSILYIEYDLLQDTKIIEVIDDNFTILFDTVQFGFKDSHQFVDLFGLNSLGVDTYSIWPEPFFLKATLNSDCINYSNKSIKSELKELLVKKYNISYFQTDIIAINNKIANNIIKKLNSKLPES